MYVSHVWIVRANYPATMKSVHDVQFNGENVEIPALYVEDVFYG